MIKYAVTFFIVLVSTAVHAGAPELKVVVTAAYVSEKGIDIYKEITDYLGKKLEIPVDLVTGTSYEESDLLLKRGIIQVGFICGLPYTQAAREGIYKLVAMPVMSIENAQFPDTPSYKNLPGKYFAYTIVKKDSDIKSWHDLRGKSFVYNDKNSNSGYNMPRYKLIQLGINKWEDFFSKTSVSGNHEQSIRLVSRGLVDASSVDSLILDYDRSIGDLDALNVRVIETMFKNGSGIPPIVANHLVDESLRLKLQDILINMHKTPEGQSILNKALIERFIKPDDSNYDDIRMMESAALDVNFVDHKE